MTNLFNYFRTSFGHQHIETENIRAGMVIVYEDFSGGSRTIKVEDVDEDIKNGRAGFTGVVIEGEEAGEEVWGYMDQVTRIVSHATTAKVRNVLYVAPEFCSCGGPKPRAGEPCTFCMMAPAPKAKRGPRASRKPACRRGTHKFTSDFAGGGQAAYARKDRTLVTLVAHKCTTCGHRSYLNPATGRMQAKPCS